MRAVFAFGLMVVAACGSSGDGSPGAASSSGGNDGGTSVCTENVVYVRANGNDANDGCDKDKPKATLTSALTTIHGKGVTTAEIRTCAETLREHVVLPYAVSIIGGFACDTWAPGAGRTTLRAGAASDVETMIAVSASVLPTVRLEHLSIVGGERASGTVSALRIRDGASPALKDVEAIGGTTADGVAITLSIEGKSSPSIEDSSVIGGHATCVTDCTSVIGSGIAIDGGKPRIRRTRVEGPTVDVAKMDTYIGSIALDVGGAVVATGADAFSALDIVPGVARVASTASAYGVRVRGNSEIDLVDSKIGDAAAVGCEVTNATARLVRDRVRSDVGSGVFVGTDARAEVTSSWIDALRAIDATRASTAEVRASTLFGGTAISNIGGDVRVRSSILAQPHAGGVPFDVRACPDATKTTFESSVVVTGSASIAVVSAGTPCTQSGTYAEPSEMAAASSSQNAFTVTNATRATCSGTLDECFATVFASKTDAKLKDGVACAIAQGGVGFADVPKDLFGAARTMPFAIGAHEYDGACSN